MQHEAAGAGQAPGHAASHAQPALHPRAERVAHAPRRVWSRGDIYKASYSGWYCVDCEEYKDEKEMDGEHNCPTHRKPCAQRSEENYFFRWGSRR